MWRARVFTLFPQMFPGPLGYSIAGRALHKGLWGLDVIDIKSFCRGYHNVDDKPYGGGAGMVLRADAVDRALSSVMARGSKVIYVTPRGKPLTQARLRACVAEGGLAVVCGHYEGIDERVIEAWQMEEISIGDYVLSGGEMAAFVLIDGCVRLLSGVVGNPQSLQEESFAGGAEGNESLLEYPHYTQPACWQGRSVPEVLMGGNHQAIETWRREQAQALTQKRRPDLLANKKRAK
ncbi:MAG: tRNA (guanosine(37)-N1)-methyltransferase TrmD [Alphaproteobacteria bacterium GM202ARS2]|nr:tRNA (guanosine(37)-N1)-methyltransferase TrmD [Alphaproteobacteria bacterium GM202ARS2]